MENTITFRIEKYEAERYGMYVIRPDEAAPRKITLTYEEADDYIKTRDKWQEWQRRFEEAFQASEEKK
jgi:hypothetical protein